MRGRISILLLFAATLLWGTVLLAALGVLQREIYQEFALALLRAARALSVAVGIVAAGTGIGMLVVRRLRLDAPPAEQWVIAASSGIGLLGTLWLWMGLVALPGPLVTLFLLLSGISLTVWFGYHTRHTYNSVTSTTESGIPFDFRAIPLLAKGFIGAMVALPLLQALAPPTSFDALLYHLRLPELWLAQGTVFQIPKDAPFFFPVLVEALYTPALQLGTAIAPQVLHWIFLGFNIVLLAHLTRRFLPTVSPLLVVILALSIQMVPLLAGWAYTDLFFACFQMGCISALLHWREARTNNWLILAGVFAGLGMGVKYLGVFTPLLGVLMIGIVARLSPQKAVGGVLRFGLVAAIIAAPSYVRNFMATGNPIFPFVLSSPYWDSFRAAWYAASGTGIGGSLSDLLALPFTVTLGIQDTSYFDGRPGPLLATFLPLTLLLFAMRRGVARERGGIAWLLFFVSGYCMVWVLGIINSAALWQGRFLVLPLLLLCPVVAWGIAQLAAFDTLRFSLSGVAHLFVGVWAGAALLIASAELITTDPLTGIVTENSIQWQQQQLGGYADLVIESQRLNGDNRLLLWFEPRSFQMPLDTQPDTLLYAFPWRLNRVNGNIDALDGALCGEGFSHVAVYWRGADFLHAESTVNPLSDAAYNALQTWRTRQTSIWKDRSNAYELFALDCS